jgi:hypothetical protein
MTYQRTLTDHSTKEILFQDRIFLEGDKLGEAFAAHHVYTIRGLIEVWNRWGAIYTGARKWTYQLISN